MDQYYGKEEDVETPEMQLDNLRAQEGATRAVDVWAQETLVGIYDKTLELWNAAGDRGDAETQNGLTELYKGAEHMQQNLLHTNAAMKSVLEAAKALAQQKQEIEGELTTLVKAVEEADLSNPHIEAMAEMIETDVYEMISYNSDYDDEAYSEGVSAAHDEITSDVYKTVKALSPQTSYMTAERFFGALKGDYEMNDIQRGLLLSLLATFAADIQVRS